MQCRLQEDQIREFQPQVSQKDNLLEFHLEHSQLPHEEHLWPSPLKHHLGLAYDRRINKLQKVGLSHVFSMLIVKPERAG